MATILVVDDNPNLRLLHEMELQDAGHEVIGAETQEEALEQLRLRVPDVVVLDLNLGEAELDGLGLIPEIRAADPDTRIVLNTAYSADRGSPVLHALADSYLEKSSDIEALLEIVEAETARIQ